MRVFGLIGHPLTHSFSGTYFEKKFRAMGLTDHVYHLFPLTDLTDFKRWALSIEGLQGLNVTIPYKKRILPFLDESRLPVGVNACNCIHLHDGKFTGYNTDVIGFSKSLQPLLKPHHNRAMVLGQGGAAEAVLYVLKQWSMPYLNVVRKPTSVDQVTFAELSSDQVREHTLIINATPLGMSPNLETFPPIPYEGVGAGHLLYDLVYNPTKTCFLQKGEERGATICNGWEMLVLQAEASWSIWNDQSAR